MNFKFILKMAQQLSDAVSQANTITLEEIDGFKNHIIRINKHAQEIEKYLKSLADSNYTSKDNTQFIYSKDDALSLKNFSIRLTDLSENNGTTQDLETAYNNVKNTFSNINQKYLKDAWIERENYKPMKEIKVSLNYIKQYIDKKRRIEALNITKNTDTENPTPP